MKKTKTDKRIPRYDRISYYFLRDRLVLTIVTVTGILYNVGLIAGPWFEGQLAQTLCDIIGGSKKPSDMFTLAALYLLVILLVQIFRYLKRFYVRRFSNDVSRGMKRVLYRNLVHRSKPETESENIGTIMTKANSDVDACAEGMRKFTTEVFDTGVVMIAFLVMLFAYDEKLALISCIFPPFAYIAANLLKKKVARRAAEHKESAGRMNGQALDRISGAMTYRVVSCEPSRDEAFEKCLTDYNRKAVRSGILETALPPLYQIVSLISVIFIVWYGAANVRGDGFSNWNIAAFTTFLSCYLKLALKSSKAAKLFNSVQKAGVSWNRIKPLMKNIEDIEEEKTATPADLTVQGLSFAYPGGNSILRDICFTAKPGQIVGVTGAVACGKSTFGKVFLCEHAYGGSIRFGYKELADMSPATLCSTVAYMGHDAELMSDTVKENILLGDDGDADKLLNDVCLDREVYEMPDGIETAVGDGGIRLSGGQQERLALARTLCHKKPLIILDDPFASLDRETEANIAANLRRECGDCILILISHRLTLFPSFDKVLWMEDGTITESTHEELMKNNENYRGLYLSQTEGGAV